MYGIRRLSFRKASWRTKVDLYHDAVCETPSWTLLASGRFKLAQKAEVDDVINHYANYTYLEYTFNRLHVTLKSKTMLKHVRRFKKCTADVTWRLNSPILLGTCPELGLESNRVTLDIVQLSMDNRDQTTLRTGQPFQSSLGGASVADLSAPLLKCRVNKKKVDVNLRTEKTVYLPELYQAMSDVNTNEAVQVVSTASILIISCAFFVFLFL